MGLSRVRFTVQGVIAVGAAALLVTWLVGTLSRLREEVRSSHCVCKLAQLKCALDIYESKYGSLPPAAITPVGVVQSLNSPRRS